MRQNEVKPLIEKVYEIIDGLKPGKNSNLGTAVTYAQNQKEKLLVFLNDPNVEMTNNLAERTVKPLVINRKNFLFCDTDKGADASADVMSIIETAKRNGLDVYGYLLYVVSADKIAGMGYSDRRTNRFRHAVEFRTSRILQTNVQ